MTHVLGVICPCFDLVHGNSDKIYHFNCIFLNTITAFNLYIPILQEYIGKSVKMSCWLSRDLGNDDENNCFYIAIYGTHCTCLTNVHRSNRLEAH